MNISAKQLAKTVAMVKARNRQGGGRNRPVFVQPRMQVAQQQMKTKKKQDTSRAQAIAKVGGLIGNHFVPGIGGFVGQAAGHVIGKILGNGAYRMARPAVSLNTLTGRTSQIPNMHTDGMKTRVTHREMLGKVSMTTDFEIRQFVIDPTRSDTFPWLARIAPNYQEYEIFGLVFEFISSSANAVSGTVAGMGEIAACVRYDPYEYPPGNLQEVTNTLAGVITKPSTDMLAEVECKRSQTSLPRLRIRNGDDYDEDKRFFEFGNFYLATEGAPNEYSGAGTLWVSYDVGLYKPKVDPYPIFVSGYRFLSVTDNDGVFSSATVSYNTLNATIVSNRIEFLEPVPEGQYMIIICMKPFTGTTTGLKPPVLTALTYFDDDMILFQGTDNDNIPSAGTTNATRTNYVAFVTATKNDPSYPDLKHTLHFGNEVVTGAQYYLDFMMCRVDGPVFFPYPMPTHVSKTKQRTRAITEENEEMVEVKLPPTYPHTAAPVARRK